MPDSAHFLHLRDDNFDACLTQSLDVLWIGAGVGYQDVDVRHWPT